MGKSSAKITSCKREKHVPFLARFSENSHLSCCGNLVPRVSPLHAPGSERGETLVGAGHVSPREKLDPGRGPWPASLCQDLLSTPKRGFRFAARSPRETHSTGYVFSVVFILRVIVTLILKLNESVVLRRYTLGTM